MKPSAAAPVVTLASLGCKLNQAEVESWARSFQRAGYTLAQPGQAPDIFIVNTCTVTGTADAKARHLLRSAMRRYPQALVIAAGCYVRRATSEIARCGPVALDEGDKEGLVARVAALLPPSGCPPGGGPPGRRARALVKIQEGCDLECSYCVVPQVRGKGRSRPRDELLQEVKALAAAGWREIVLTGTEIGAYGQDRPGDGGLAALVKDILKATGVARLRLSSLQPQEVTFLDLWRDPRLCPHLHLPLQSGSDAVLRAMGRSYTTQLYREVVAWAREAIPHLAITTDVMVGFPGEGEAEFRESYEFCGEMGFARLHVFPYSPRPGTPAAGWPQVAPEVKKRRTQAMLALAEESSRRFRQCFLGQALDVLWEEEVAPGLWSGHTGNYLRAFAFTQEPLGGRITPARILKLRDGGVEAAPLL